MAHKIKSWQIVNGKLEQVIDKLADAGRLETIDLEEWVYQNPVIIGEDIVFIGRQVSTKSGPLDILGIDKNGNTVIVELKRDKLPREAIAQIIDYASNIKSLTAEDLDEICEENTGHSIEDVITESFQDVSLDTLRINETQRLILVGFTTEVSLERMINYLADGYSLNINAVVLSYVKTKNGDELINRSTVIDEETESQKIKEKKFTFKIPMSDDPGNYEMDVLEEKWKEYFSKQLITIQRMKEVMLPKLAESKKVTREEMKKFLVEGKVLKDDNKAGYVMVLISNQMGMQKNDFLRQVIEYDYPNYEWEKDNYRIRKGYEEFIEKIIKAT